MRSRASHAKSIFSSYPNYKYQPVYRRSQVVRRQIKADPVEEKKCALVANLLLDGKNGDELKKETKKAVERSNKQRAKVARSLAEAR
jgi:HMG box factor